MEDIEWCRENVECYEELMRIINREFYNAGRDLDDAEKCFKDLIQGDARRFHREFGVIIDEETLQQRRNIYNGNLHINFLYYYLHEYCKEIIVKMKKKGITGGWVWW